MTAPAWLIVISLAPIRALTFSPARHDRDRVTVLADRDQRLGVHARRRGLGRVERLAGQRAQPRALGRPRLADRLAASDDPPAQVRLAAREQQRVELGQVRDRRDGDQVVAAEAPDLALDATLLVRALDARRGELRHEQVVRAQRDEPVGLHAPPSLEDLLDRRAQVVEADLLEDAAEPLERLDVELQERLLGLDQRRLAERRARERRAHQEQMHPRRDASQLDLRLAPVDLRQHAGRVDLRDEHLADRPTHRALSRAHVVADRRLGNLGAVLVDQPPPDPLRRVALLARRLAIGLKPRVDQRAIRAKPRRRPALTANASQAAPARPTPA